jgi:hypothetical protein
MLGRRIRSTTVEGANQYNMEWIVAGKWTNYHAGEKNKKYDCGRCHTTGYSDEGHQDGLEGIVGTWATWRLEETPD